MLFNFTYAKSSVIEHSGETTKVNFSPDLKREPVFFRGKLKNAIMFREAMSALREVVVSDLRYKKKDRSEYMEWLKGEEMKRLAKHMEGKSELVEKMNIASSELKVLQDRQYARWKPYYDARNKLRKYLEAINPAFRWVFDPVITVHPDELFFECFSQDESSYARLGAGYDLFENISEYECGTTNIDFSAQLFGEMQKIRTYKSTHFEIDPAGFQVETTGEEIYKEKKIDLPDSWVRGFLQVQSAMSLPMVSFTLSPVDIYNMCLFMRQNREKESPRALRYELTPGKPVTAVFEPWEYRLECSCIWEGEEPVIIRTWGRRRLHILERLIPVTKKVKVCLLGRGLPSFYVMHLDNMVFTLGLSGWTANDWSGEGNFDLLSSRAKVDVYETSAVLNYLKEKKFAPLDEIAFQTKLDRAKVSGALNLWCQSGKVTYDLAGGTYRYRELTKEQIPLDDLTYRNEREKSAGKFLEEGSVSITSRKENGGLEVSGKIKDDKNTYDTDLTLDRDDRIIKAECTCYWHKQNKLRKGPCEHIIALRSFSAREENFKFIKERK